jgi:hypothetical protein
LCEESQVYGIVDGKSSNGCGKRCAVEDSKMLLSFQRNWLDAVYGQGFSGGDYFAGIGCALEHSDGRVTHEGSSNIGQGRKIYMTAKIVRIDSELKQEIYLLKPRCYPAEGPSAQYWH